MVEERMAYRSRVFVRTQNAIYEGTIALPVRTRLKEFLARPQPTFVLTDVVITTSSAALVDGTERVHEVNVFKNQVQFMTTLEEVKSARGRIYERDVVAAKMSRELYSFRLSAGFVVKGEIVGGEQTIVYHKGSFLAVSQPSVIDVNQRELDRGFSYVLINLGAVESFRRLFRVTDALSERAALARAEIEKEEKTAHDPEMDFSDFEDQFVRIDKPVQVPSQRDE